MPAATPEPAALTIDGKVYSIDPEDLELGEIELLEDELDAPLADIDFNRAKAMRVLVYILVHRDNPAFTPEDAKRIKVSALAEAPTVSQNGKRPTKAAS